MIVLRTEGDRAERVFLDGVETAPVYSSAPREMTRLVEAHPDSWLAWHDRRLEISDPASWPGLVRHPLEVLHAGGERAGSLGLVDFDSPWILPGPVDRPFDTWLISPAAGIGRAAAFRALAPDPSWSSFAGFLFDLGLRGVRHGLFPRSHPGLFQGEGRGGGLPESDLTRLIRRGYGRRWVGFWLLARLLFDRKLPLDAAVRGWLSEEPGTVDESALAALHPPLLHADGTVDALIPTLGRPGPLRDVLEDLARQTVPLRRVIVVDQGGTTSEPAGNWPFELVFRSIHSAGACSARNTGLQDARSDWVLLLDDDVRLRPELTSYLLRVANAYGAGAVNAQVYLPSQEPSFNGLPRPWPVFASGASLVSARALVETGGFDERLDGGYGEDYELGVRLRLAGAGVVYAPAEPVLHLKAPAGGFRDPSNALPWDNDPILPKPSPPLLYSRHKHHTKAMRDGYRLFYALKRLSRQPLHAWPREARTISCQWERAVWWVRKMATDPPG